MFSLGRIFFPFIGRCSRREKFCVLFGFALGISAFNFMLFDTVVERLSARTKIHLYNDDMAKKLADNVTILCLVHTYPPSHKSKAVVVKNTWGKRCTKLLFVTSQPDPDLDTLIVPMEEESRYVLCNKTKYSFLYAFDHYLNDFDWFLKADEDSYIIMENLRYLLYQHRTETALLLGHRLTYLPNKDPEGYMAGGGYVLSRKALVKFEKKVRYSSVFEQGYSVWEDEATGRALEHEAILVDCRDEMQQLRFFHVHIQELLRQPMHPDHWFSKQNYYKYNNEGLGCCSDVPFGFHYIKDPEEMHNFEKYIYCEHPFGLEKNLTESLPRKLSLKEIIEASDGESISPYYFNHTDYHNMTSSEVF